MEKILFLDIDDVLVNKSLTEKEFNTIMAGTRIGASEEQEKEAFYIAVSLYDEDAVRRLLAVLEQTGAKIVIHSSWGRMLGAEFTKRVLEATGISENFFHKDWITPKKFSSNKSHEINFWLEDYLEENNEKPLFVILDDDKIFYWEENNKYPQVIPEKNIGLTDKEVLELLEILK